MFLPFLEILGGKSRWSNIEYHSLYNWRRSLWI